MGRNVTISEALKQTKQELGIAGSLVEQKLDEYAQTHREFAALRAKGDRLNIERAGILALDYNHKFENQIKELEKNGGLEGIAQARTIRGARNHFNDIMRGPTILERALTEPYKDEDGVRLTGYAGAGAAFLASLKLLWSKPMGMFKKAGLVIAATLGGGALTTLIPWVKDKIFGGPDTAADQQPAASPAESPATEELLEARATGNGQAQTLVSANQAPDGGTTLITASAQDAGSPIQSLNESARQQVADASAALRAPASTLSRQQNPGLDLPPQFPVVEGIRIPNTGPSYVQNLAINQQNAVRNYFNAYPNRFGNMQFNANAPNPYFGLQRNGGVPYSDASLHGNAGIMPNVYGAGNYLNHGMTPNMLAGFKPQYNFGTYVPNHTGMVDYHPGSRGLLSHINEAELPNFPSIIGGGDRLSADQPHHGLAGNAVKRQQAAMQQP